MLDALGGCICGSSIHRLSNAIGAVHPEGGECRTLAASWPGSYVGGTVRPMPGQDEVTVGAHTVVLVEGVSDRLAVTALAARRGRDLRAEGVAVLPMQGATNICHYLQHYGPDGLHLGLAGLCDVAEMRYFQKGFERAGLGAVTTRDELEDRRFFVCAADLEDELIRALGVDAVERLLEEHGDLASFRILQRQPDQQGKSDQARLRRFMGTRGGRKIKYAPLFVDALDLKTMPRPLARLVTSI